jgi:hypothetical protein
MECIRENAFQRKTPLSGRVHGGKELFGIAQYLSNSDALRPQCLPDSSFPGTSSLMYGAPSYQDGRLNATDFRKDLALSKLFIFSK